MTGDLLQRPHFLQPLKHLFDDDVTDWFVGFDKVMEDLAAKWDKAFEGFADTPSSKVEDKGDGTYAIDIAVPGFTKDQLTVEVIDDELVVTGKVDATSKDEGKTKEEHRSFSQRFLLADAMKVDRATFADGALHLDVSTTPKTPAPATKIPID